MEKISDGFILENNIKVPCIGLGTWLASEGDECYESVLHALEVGYRHIDTAAIYGNEISVGKAIKDSKCNREDIFVTSKLWNSNRGYDATIYAFDETLKKLNLDYLDLYLIHWPNPIDFRSEWQQMNADTWKAMEDLYKDGKIKVIGISNFMIHHIVELLKTATIEPMINQIRLCPGDTKDELVEYCQSNNILLEAYSPFARGDVFKINELKEIADAHNKKISQIVLRWCLQRGFVSLPKSVTFNRINENLDIFDFELTPVELNIINKVEIKNTKAYQESILPDETDF